MITYINKLIKQRKGQAMVELTVAIPTLFLFFSAILYFGRNLNAKISVRAATRHAVLADGRPDRSGGINKGTLYNQFFLDKGRNQESFSNRFNYSKGTEDKNWIRLQLVGYYGVAAATAKGPKLIHGLALAAMQAKMLAATPGANTATCSYKIARTSLFGKIMSGLNSKNYTTEAKLWTDYHPMKISSGWILLAAAIWADPFHIWGGFEWDFSSFTTGKFGKDISWWKKCNPVW